MPSRQRRKRAPTRVRATLGAAYDVDVGRRPRRPRCRRARRRARTLPLDARRSSAPDSAPVFDRRAARTLTLRELNRATLARQLLLERERTDVVDAVERLGGLQAQEAKPPFIGLWTRLHGFRREQLHDALHERRVVRATTMRATLHLVSAADYAALRTTLQPVLQAAMAAVRGRDEGLDVERLLPVARELLGEEPRTFNELRTLLVEAFPGVNERALGYATRMHLPLRWCRATIAGRSRATRGSRWPSPGSTRGWPAPIPRRWCAATSARSAPRPPPTSGVVGPARDRRRAGGHARRAGGLHATGAARCSTCPTRRGPARTCRRRRASARVRQPAARAQGPHARDHRRAAQVARDEEPARQGDVPRRRLRGRQLEHGAQARHGDADGHAVRASCRGRSRTSSPPRARRCCASSRRTRRSAASSSPAGDVEQAAARPRARPAAWCARARSARPAAARAPRGGRGSRRPPGTSTCAESAAKPDVTSQTCRSCTSLTPGCAASACPTAAGSIPRGAASSSTRVAWPSRPKPERTISAATSSATTTSARSQPGRQHEQARQARPRATRRGRRARARGRPRR